MTDRKKTKKISKARIYRAVASSTAIETDEPVEVIELKLKNRKVEFRGIRLQLAL